MRQRRLVRTTGALLGLALVVAACGSDNKTTTDTTAAGGAPKEYSIAYVGPLTGDAANLGIYIRDGAKVAVDEFNKANPDIKITLKEFDTQGDPAQAPTVLDKYINDDSILGIVGPAFSGETKAVLPTLEENNLVMVSASATNTELPNVVAGSKSFHRVLPDDAAQAAGIVKYLNAKLKPSTIAIVHDNSEYGKGLAVDQVATQLPSSTKVVVTEAIDPKSQDFSAAVNAVKAAAPDAVFFGGYYEAAGRLKKQLDDAGVTATYISDDGALDSGFVKAAGDAAEGSLLSCPCYFASDASPGAIGDFAKAYEALIGNVPGTYSTEAFDSANILMTGIKEGNTDRASLRDYVEGLTKVDYAISKDVTFEENGNIKAQGIFIFRVKDGKIVLETATDDL
ncbi:MAG: branched-chain amino acid ABC transporter substrate-binding protein [Microthrixaceae bacterium]